MRHVISDLVGIEGGRICSIWGVARIPEIQGLKSGYWTVRTGYFQGHF